MRILRRISALFEVLFVALFGSFAASLPFALAGMGNDILSSSRNVFLYAVLEASITIGGIFALLSINRRNFGWLGWSGFGRHREWLIGIACVPGLLLMASLIIFGVRALWPELDSETNELLALIRTPGDLILFLLTSILVGGIKEEIQRAYILRRFDEDLGGAVAGLLVWSFVFGALHSAQGIDRAIAAGFLGLVFGLLYLKSRNLVAPIAAHALYDIVTVTIAAMSS